jgi:hypothetical protein
MDYTGSLHREMLCTQLAQLTGLRELDAPTVLQADGGTLVEPVCVTVLQSKQKASAPVTNSNFGSRSFDWNACSRILYGLDPMQSGTERSWGMVLCALNSMLGGVITQFRYCLCRNHYADIALQADLPCSGGARLRHC